MLRRSFSTTSALRSYADTIGNLRIHEGTRVIFQGFTGKQATATAAAALRWGTNVVGGVTPGKSGEHLGLPLLPDMKEAARVLKPDATAVFVAAHHAAAAIESALEAEIPLVVAVAEHVPVHDMLRVHAMLQTQSKTRLLGANCPGIINPGGRCLVGFLPHLTFLPGTIGIVGKSGTLSYEAVASTTRVGLGQSLVVGMGGDWCAGTTLTDAVKVFLEDEKTEGIIVIGEIGGSVELEVAEVLAAWKGKRKPVMGLVAGLVEKKGEAMGHAGAVRMFGDVDAATKVRALENAGVTMVTHPGQFGEGMLKLLGRRPPAVSVKGMGPDGPKRGYHTSARSRSNVLPAFGSQQRRGLHLKAEQSSKFINEHAPEIPLSTDPPMAAGTTFSLALSIDRSTNQPTILISTDFDRTYTTFPFPYPTGPTRSVIDSLTTHLSLPLRDPALTTLINSTWSLFARHEAYAIHYRSITPNPPNLQIPASGTSIFFDRAAYNLRHPDILALHSPTPAEAFGIAYHTLPGAGTIGTLVNGAGLAMNTVDALVHYGGEPANFLDTGGKATSETVKESFRIVLADPRVKAVFVNICGGLTDCRMIARGILLAFEQLDVRVPVVLRMKGTNEVEGQMMIRESGLGIEVEGELEMAARRVAELAKAGG